MDWRLAISNDINVARSLVDFHFILSRMAVSLTYRRENMSFGLKEV